MVLRPLLWRSRRAPQEKTQLFSFAYYFLIRNALFTNSFLLAIVKLEIEAVAPVLHGASHQFGVIKSTPFDKVGIIGSVVDFCHNCNRLFFFVLLSWVCVKNRVSKKNTKKALFDRTKQNKGKQRKSEKR